MALMMLFLTIFLASTTAVLGQNNNVTTHIVVTNTTIVCPSTDIDALYRTNLELKETIIQMWNALTARLDTLENRLSCLADCTQTTVTSSTTTTTPIPRLEEKIYQNLKIDENWTVIYDQPYNHSTTSTELLNAASACSDQVLVGARRNRNDSQLAVAAVGPTEVLRQRTAVNATAKFGDVHWYAAKEFSFGFSPNNQIIQYQADTTNTTSEYRLSWHLDKSSGGYRAGSALGLNSNSVWRKVIYCLY